MGNYCDKANDDYGSNNLEKEISLARSNRGSPINRNSRPQKVPDKLKRLEEKFRVAQTY